MLLVIFIAVYSGPRAVDYKKDRKISPATCTDSLGGKADHIHTK